MSDRDDTQPGTRDARRERVRRSTKSSAIATAAAALTVPSADVEEVLTSLYEVGREQGRLQERGAVEEARLDAASARERATRYSAQWTEVRGITRRLRLDGVRVPQELMDVIWPQEIG